MLADYVTLEQGTGAVHTAPGHGADDYLTGIKYGLEIYAPIGPDGRFTDEVGLFAGEQVFEANPAVVEALTERGRLWHYEPYEHTYPHCWRCHNPVIFLATSQWFVRMDGEPCVTPDGTSPRTLRDAALHAIDQQVEWIPSLGPRPHLQHGGEPARLVHLAPARLGRADSGAGLHEVRRGRPHRRDRRAGGDRVRRVRRRRLVRAADRGVRAGGPDVPASAAAATFERENNILDVWFDSGSSHEAVLPFRPELTWPADLYLEGSDQHRGWFQSSLLVGLGHARRAAVPGGPHPRLLRGRGRPEDVQVARQHHRAAGDHREERRRDHPLVGRDGGLPRGDPDRQGDPGARRRGVPEAAQHGANPGGEPVRLRSRATTWSRPRPSSRWTATSCRGTRRWR